MRILHYLRALTLGIRTALGVDLSSLFKTRAAVQLEKAGASYEGVVKVLLAHGATTPKPEPPSDRF